MSQGTIGNNTRIPSALKRGRNTSDDRPAGEYNDHRRAVGVGVVLVGGVAVLGAMAGQQVQQAQPQTVTVVPSAPTNEATPGVVFSPSTPQYQDHSFSNPAASKSGQPTKGSTANTTGKKTSVKVKLTAAQTNPKTVQNSISQMQKNGQIYQATGKFDTKNPGKPMTNSTDVYNHLKGNQPIYYHSHNGKWMEFRNSWDLEFYEGYYLGSAGWGAPVVPVYYYPVWSDPGYYDGTCGLDAPGTYGSDVGPDGSAPVQGTCTNNTCAAGWQDCAPPTNTPDTSCANSSTCAPLPESNNYDPNGVACNYTPPTDTCVGCSDNTYTGTTCTTQQTCTEQTCTQQSCTQQTCTQQTCTQQTCTWQNCTNTCSNSNYCSGSTYCSGSYCSGGGSYCSGGCGGFAGCAVRGQHGTTTNTTSQQTMATRLQQLLTQSPLTMPLVP
ncbi:MAG TPA: hypothetical protein VGO93_10295 [Candidatus Xenobia bacterium]|jgi:hypothetical protein